MKSTEYTCPACHNPLLKELHPNPSKRNPNPYTVLYCGNPRCPSDVAQNDGGSADTEHKAYLSLCNAMDNETENECDLIAKQDRDKWAVAERKNDQEGTI